MDARAFECKLTTLKGMMDGKSTTWDWSLVSALALWGMALGSHGITNDDTVWRRVILSLVCALSCYVPLEAETPLEAWLYHRT
jgi:hypothetical protein